MVELFQGTRIALQVFCVAVVVILAVLLVQGGHGVLGVGVAALGIVLAAATLVSKKLLLRPSGSKKTGPVTRHLLESGVLGKYCVETTGDFRCTPQELWAVIRPADAGVMFGDSKIAFTATGTGPGVGEIQCFVSASGMVSGGEVVAEKDSHFAVMRTVNETNVHHATYWLVDTDTGCSLTMGHFFDPTPGHFFTLEGMQFWSKHDRAFRTRVRQFLRDRESQESSMVSGPSL